MGVPCNIITVTHGVPCNIINNYHIISISQVVRTRKQLHLNPALFFRIFNVLFNVLLHVTLLFTVSVKYREVVFVINSSLFCFSTVFLITTRVNYRINQEYKIEIENVFLIPVFRIQKGNHTASGRKYKWDTTLWNTTLPVGENISGTPHCGTPHCQFEKI